ncbi:hypothetical protein [Cellulosimicrobium cellulans]|uniref:hypothetical protein n=1 Tax=Cellulosimicrobium cellulans TaxID=1710 RepID=UPI0020CE4D25|nr:hypothetical protein NMQ07_11080 [Cellulosimicrobium cellulans]
MFWDARRPEIAYLVGLLQTDGCHDGDPDRKGRIALELAVRDRDVLDGISSLLPCYSSVRLRHRTTNFSSDHVSATLGFFDQTARRELAALGVTPGRKSSTIGPPPAPFAEVDYTRGILDGDGSVGFTKTGMPFISLVTASPSLAAYFCSVIAEVCGVRRSAKPNARDGVMNIMVANVAAAALARWAWYSPDALCIGRKRRLAEAVAAWRPEPGRESRYAIVRKGWTPDQDAIALELPLEEAAATLGRSVRSVSVRRWRLSTQHSAGNAG